MSFSMAGLVREHARTRADEIALVSGDRRLTWADLHRRSSRLGNALIKEGVRPKDRVGLLMKNTPEFHEIAFGCSKINAAVAGLNWRLAKGEIAAILEDANLAALVVDGEHRELVSDLEGDLSKLRVIQLGDEYDSMLGKASEKDPDVATAPDDVTLILYSSGTTGKPKGIMISNQNLSFTRRMADELFRMRPESVHLVASPLFHIGGAGTGLTLMTLGGRTVLTRDASAEHLLELIENERVTHAFFVPAVIQRLVELQEVEKRDLSTLELVAYGAAPMTEALLRRSIDVLGCGFLGCYGMTETSGTVTALFPEEHVAEGPDARLLRSVGRSLRWAEVRVTNMETGVAAEPGEVGEIWVRSKANMLGYLDQPEATAETLVEGGWLRTGDGAYSDEQGYLFLQDRIKDMIISGGENIYPIELENVIADHPAVSDVAVIGVPHERWGETPKAVIVLKAGVAADAADIIEFTRSRLARYKCPTSVEFVDELPRTATGKVLKKTLRAQFVPAGGQSSSAAK